jgi:hypothetical protein
VFPNLLDGMIYNSKPHEVSKANTLIEKWKKAVFWETAEKSV